MKMPLTVGDTYGDILSWRWDRTSRRFEASHAGRVIHIQFHKVGGRYSKTLTDGTPNPNGAQSYWTWSRQGAGIRDTDRSLTKFKTADEAKTAAVLEYRRRFG